MELTSEIVQQIIEKILKEKTAYSLKNDYFCQLIKEVEVKEVYEKINDLQNENNELKLKLNNGISAFSIKELIKEIVKKLKK
jgi:hypothetical protein